MNANAVIYWMAHAGEGSWSAFKRAVASVVAPDDVAAAARLLRARFSDLGIAEFFVDGTDRWRAFAPLITASPHRPDEAFLSGVRTPRLMTGLRAAAARAKCGVFEPVVDGLFTTVKLHGARIADAAATAHVGFEADAARLLAAALPSLSAVIEAAPVRAPPRTWQIKSLDFASTRWVDGFKPKSATEYTSIYQERRYFVQLDEGHAIELPKREAIFAAASLQDVKLLRYDVATRELSTPLGAPLPEPHARAACVSAGRASVTRGDRLVYEQVAPQLAGVILVSLGHLPPLFWFCTARPSRRRR